MTPPLPLVKSPHPCVETRPDLSRVKMTLLKCCARRPCFETLAPLAPQHEVVVFRGLNFILKVKKRRAEVCRAALCRDDGPGLKISSRREGLPCSRRARSASCRWPFPRRASSAARWRNRCGQAASPTRPGLDLAGDFVGFLDDAVDRRAFDGLHLSTVHREYLLKALHMGPGFPRWARKPCLSCLSAAFALTGGVVPASDKISRWNSGTSPATEH